MGTGPINEHPWLEPADAEVDLAPAKDKKGKEVVYERITTILEHWPLSRLTPHQ